MLNQDDVAVIFIICMVGLPVVAGLIIRLRSEAMSEQAAEIARLRKINAQLLGTLKLVKQFEPFCYSATDEGRIIDDTIARAEEKP